MKILIKHSVKCTAAHFEYLKLKFENFGFKVLNKNVCCVVTELEVEDLSGVDYVIDFARMCFLNTLFLNDLKRFMALKIQQMITNQVLYFNEEKGLMKSSETLVSVYPSAFPLMNFFTILDNPTSFEGAVIAAELNEKHFDMKSGVFHGELLTNEMLQNGDWKV